MRPNTNKATDRPLSCHTRLNNNYGSINKSTVLWLDKPPDEFNIRISGSWIKYMEYLKLRATWYYPYGSEQILRYGGFARKLISLRFLCLRTAKYRFCVISVSRYFHKTKNLNATNYHYSDLFFTLLKYLIFSTAYSQNSLAQYILKLINLTPKTFRHKMFEIGT